MRKFACVISALACMALAQTEEEREKYAQWTEVCDRFGYEWEPHEVETEDGWFVTVFRITKAKGQDLTKSEKPPILLQHGSAQSAFEWLGYSPLGPTLPG